MTTKGDVILGDTGGTPTRLAAGTSAYVLTSNGAAAFPPRQAAAGGGGALGGLSYSSGANGVWKSTSSGTLADIDATNAALAITIPASGNILVMIQGEFCVTVSHSNCVLGVRAATTNLARKLIPTLGSGGVTTTYGPAIDR